MHTAHHIQRIGPLQINSKLLNDYSEFPTFLLEQNQIKMEKSLKLWPLMMIILFLDHQYQGVSGKGIKTSGLMCAVCNANGNNPDECNTEAGNKATERCDPAGKFLRDYYGCATVTGTNDRGETVTSKGCVADCTQECIANAIGKRVPADGCVSMNEEQTRLAQMCFLSTAKQLQPYLVKTESFCYCEDQACNEKNIGETINGEKPGGSGAIISGSFINLSLVSVAVFIL